MNKNTLSISELRRSLINDLAPSFSTGEAHSIARIILDHMGYAEISILKDPSVVVDYKIQAEIKKIVDELHQNRPIQYILGETEFYGISLKINDSVLIPRPETEELADIIIRENRIENPVILDIGTGSGCLAIALGLNITGAVVMAMDIDENAISLARENARNNNLDIEFMADNLLAVDSLPVTRELDIIVSNPPYVTLAEKVLMNPNVVDFEPSIALFVPDDDPLIFYKAIIKLADKHLSNKGVVWVEINEALGEETSDLFREAGYAHVDLLRDIHDRERFIKAIRSNERV